MLKYNKDYLYGLTTTGQANVFTYEVFYNTDAFALSEGIGANVYTYNDYYPFGSTARSGGITYRYEYQGAYAEKDPITGFNNFDLRMYDGRIGRWLSTDPNAQFYSPYVGMGNNPVTGIDPDGGVCTTCPPAGAPSKPVDGVNIIGGKNYFYDTANNSWSNMLADVTVTAAYSGGGGNYAWNWMVDNKDKLFATAGALANGYAGVTEITGGSVLMATPTGVGQIAGGYLIADGITRIATSAVNIYGIYGAKNVMS